ncbi:putative RNA-directed DNA polymerase [Helianthus annuus]|uniref:RNA-directed DNA polymerase n=1 Tax=Helianthus annuus TaxID=4232 RepID=A0A9K3ELX9_HELAN|nr:putative RNA-directed DNA polymerase [Helianthus annuus]
MVSTKFELEKFDGRNDFSLWRVKMRALLVHNGVVDALKGEDRLPNELSAKEKKEILEKAHSAIILSLGDRVLREVSKEASAAGVWAKLETLYMTKSLANRLYLKKRLYTFKMESGKSLEEHTDDFNKLVLDLENIEVTLEDEDKAILFLTSLPSSYESFVDTLMYARETLSMEEVLAALNSKELKKKTVDKEEGSDGLYVRGRPENRSSKSFKGSSSRSKSKTKFKRKCFVCNSEKHLKKDCPEWKRKKTESSSSKSYTSHSVQEDSSDGYDSADVLSVTWDEVKKHWVMDSGCSFHMTPRREYFKDLKMYSLGTVQLGDDRPCQILGIGTIVFKMNNGTEVVLKNVRYIPSLKRSLLSLGTFERDGYHVLLKDGKAKVIKGSLVVLTGTRKDNNIYLLDGSVASNEVSAVISDKENETTLKWHRRLGHVSSQGLMELKKQQVIKELTSCDVGFCENCIMGKQKRVKFMKGKHNTRGILDYVHSDLWGPARVESLGGARYFMTVIDDFSRRVWVFILKHKSEAFKKFKEWKIYIENQTERKIKKLRTDNGLEYCNKEFEELCAESGIGRHLTIPGTPQQNGLAERMNRTLLERVRCMRLSAGLPKTFWAEAVKTAAYLINMCPSRAINMKSPMEVWTGEPPNYEDLRVFGTLAFAHTSQDKLESRAIKCIFLGYQEREKGYRLWKIEGESPRIIKSRNVEFQEKIYYKDVMNGKSSKSVNTSQEDVQIEVETSEIVSSDVQNEESPTVETETTSEQSGDYWLSRDRERRNVIKPLRFRQNTNVSAVAFITAENECVNEHLTYYQAISSKEKEEWHKAMQEEMSSLIKNKTWELVKKPKDQKVVACKWIYKIKEGIPGVENRRFKARLVAKGFTQKEGVDYTEIFSPVVKHTSIRILLAITAALDLELEQLDVKTAFLHGYLDEKIYMAQPLGFVEEGSEEKVCLLKRSLYGLKQSPRQWYKRFDEFMTSSGFARSSYDSCVYYREYCPGNYVYLLLYVDDMLIACKHKEQIKEVKELLKSEFEMKELGDAKKILGMEICRDRQLKKLKLTQSAYVKKILENYRMEGCKAVKTPLGAHFKLSLQDSPKTEQEERYMNSVPYANVVGSMMYLMVCTRPDLAYAVSVVSRYLSCPGKVHWEAVKWILRYLKGTQDWGLVFGDNASDQQRVVGFVDADFAKDPDKGRSVTGYMFKVLGNMVSWKSQLQHIVALSTTESEYVALTEAVKEALWLKGILKELGIKANVPVICCDNQGAIQLSKNSVYHERTKHISVKLHFIRDIVNKKLVEIKWVETEQNTADVFTKCLPGSKFYMCLADMRVG